jgi:hypothetical protein
MIVEVENAKLMLRCSIKIATSGVALTPEQAKLLVKLGNKIHSFQIKLLCHWVDGSFTNL